jgi:hypothetical protein
MTTTFPRRPSRGDFGPRMSNRQPIRFPEFEFDAENQGRPLFFQDAGMGRTAILARLRLSISGEALVWREEAWNPDGETTGAYVAPTITKPATGDLQIAYPANVLDEEGNEQPLLFTGGHAVVAIAAASTSLYHASVRLVDPDVPSSIVRVKAWVWATAPSPNWLAHDAVSVDVWLW